MEFQVYYVFCGPNQAHWCLEIREISWASQRKHSQFPSSPFCDCNNRQSTSIQEACTTSWIYIQWMGAVSRHPYKIRNLPVWLGRLLSGYFLALYLCGRCHFCAYGQLILRLGTCKIWLFTLANSAFFPL